MNKRTVLVLLLVAMLSILPGFRDKPSDIHIVPGKLIVQLNDSGYEVIELKANFSFAGLETERCLSADLNIWLMSYDHTRYSADILLDMLAMDKNVAHVQPEHYISLREVFPNDVGFAMQWALFNLGNSGGVEDADIDATDAWEISVNDGYTVLGDTIVIAVIDDGFYLGHEDMNYWKNRNEIPGNGIDDDNNGYIDDFDGWNAYTGTGEIISKSHGTRVAGIAGAVGNNEIGVCGVGWNGRILPVAGSSTFESTVVEAFAYVYKMRSLYEETNGESGAYIVATNGSFGVDYADPEDYPIWHLMYDSLGSLGILSAAATMNNAVNVETEGDVPTQFDTDYLIAVTNTTNSDKKYSTAAWGPVSIDLGAPGSNILSTRVFNSYGYSTGTSMASPHVAGSIGLIFGCADSSFLEQYRESPAETALFLKDIILEGVDTLSDFDTLCVSGGRLNVNNTLQILLQARMQIELDTLSLTLGEDTIAHRSVLLSNLVGLELGYYCRFQSLPDWIAYYPTAGYVPEYGFENLNIGFRTEGLDFGTYYSILEIRDHGGWSIPLVLELNVIPDLGLDEPSLAKGLKVYPNPFTDNINIILDSPDGAPCDLIIYNMAGRTVFRQACDGKKVRWHDDSLPSGIYIVHMKGKGINYQQKIIKQ